MTEWSMVLNLMQALAIGKDPGQSSLIEVNLTSRIYFFILSPKTLLMRDHIFFFFFFFTSGVHCWGFHIYCSCRSSSRNEQWKDYSKKHSSSINFSSIGNGCCPLYFPCRVNTYFQLMLSCYMCIICISMTCSYQ